MADVSYADVIRTVNGLIKTKYPEITKENIHGILQKEIGIVFTHVLEDAGVYKCTTEGREAFMCFLETL